MMPCWHQIGEVWHSFLPNTRISLCKKYNTEEVSRDSWVTSVCLPDVDPRAMRVCDICFREYCVEVISY